MLPSLQYPQLHNGDRMSREEFLRTWEQIPNLKHAELIKGVVYLASPVSVAHGSYDTRMNGWLDHYAYISGKDFLVTANTTLLTPDGSSLQPDAAMLNRPHANTAAAYLEDVPDLVVEVAYSSQAYDLGPKMVAYRSAGVREYVVVLLRDQRVEWRVLAGTRYRLLHQPKDGILRSPHHPGLWLDTGALFPLDRQRLYAAIERGVALSAQ